MTAALLEAADVSKRFGGLEVLKRVSFTVMPREIVALVGPNGAGKTTLFNMVSGLQRPSGGALRLHGQSLAKLPPHRITRMGVGRTFQSPRPFAHMSVAENLRAAVAFAAGEGLDAGALGALVGLGGADAAAAGGLSALQRKRLELGMALAGAPRLLLLDEILGGLTPAEARAIIELLLRVRHTYGTTIFWIDHVLWAVMQTADRVIVLHHGEVIEQGAPEAVSRSPQVIEAYLGREATGQATAKETTHA